MAIRVQNIFWLFKENFRTQTLWWVQNVSLSHIYLICFFIVVSVFFRVWLQSLKKVLIWPEKIIFLKIINKSKKRRISCWFQIHWKSFFFKCKKFIIETSLMNMNKSGKSAYFRHILGITFLYKFF